MPKKIMIADDDSAIVDALRAMLELHEYTVEDTMGIMTIKAVEKHLPDLILLDMWMPGIKGDTICRILKSKIETKHIPIIVISASKNIKSLALDAGAEDFIEKPFEMDLLLKRISLLLR